MPARFHPGRQVVPTVYADASNRTTSNQYSVTEHFRESAPVAGPVSARTLPGVFFFYDLSPIKVLITQQRPSFWRYVTNLCAIIGGVFAVSGLLDNAAYGIARKMQMGKQA